ncbi:DUF4381 domain-containing protein [Vibrio lamellibrachiae]|uniref:DUF4381 domain-containing protein n=1 Tax=Vibrio lamellibrachiae TaxID=2910253 RepID=UPI003D0E8C7D
MTTEYSTSPDAWSVTQDKPNSLPKDWGNESLTGFVEVSFPNDISWLPQTIGWYLVALFIVLWLLYQLAMNIIQYRENHYRRVALQRLDALHEAQDGLVNMPSLLKETAIFAFPRSEVASLSGLKWERWLDEKCANSEFSTTYQNQLMRIAYCKTSDVERETKEGIYLAIRQWIRNHERQVC